MRLKLLLFILILLLWAAWRINNIYSHTLPKEIEG
jgi:hypothetical protein